MRRPPYCDSEVSDDANVRGARPTIALLELELDLLAFREGAESVHLQCAVMHEDVLPVILLEESKTLFVTEPLYAS